MIYLYSITLNLSFVQWPIKIATVSDCSHPLHRERLGFTAFFGKGINKKAIRKFEEILVAEMEAATNERA
ncbi:MAG TPA: hypothetical protein ACHBX0_09075 [Arsenophonus sp.]